MDEYDVTDLRLFTHPKKQFITCNHEYLSCNSAYCRLLIFRIAFYGRLIIYPLKKLALHFIIFLGYYVKERLVMGNKYSKPVLLLTLLHVVISFYTDTLIFQTSASENISTYIPCKILMFVTLYLFWSFIFSKPYDTLKYSLIYLIPLSVIVLYYIPRGIPNSDEMSILQSALVFDINPWFYYITIWYYIISMMIIPCKFAPIIIKIVIQVLMCGFSVKSICDIYGRKFGYIMYIPFY